MSKSCKEVNVGCVNVSRYCSVKSLVTNSDNAKLYYTFFTFTNYDVFVTVEGLLAVTLANL